jgi:zinc protease
LSECHGLAEKTREIIDNIELLKQYPIENNIMSLNLTASHPNLYRLILNNGITLLVVENQAADLVSGRFFFKNAGTMVENREGAGLSHLVASVITKGTENLSALEIAEKVESIGAGLGADTSTDYFSLSLKTVTSDFPAILKLCDRLVFPQQR